MYVNGDHAREVSVDVTGDRVDAYPDFMNKICNPKKDKKRIYVSQTKDELYYDTNNRRRGLAVIFNHENFDLHSLKQRIGTEVDCQNLEKTFHNMGFEVQKYLDLTFKELDAVLDDLSTYDYSDCDCLLICVLSHGEQSIIYAKNMSYSTNVLFDRFTPDRCPSLAGKPKLFVIQACQGDKLDSGVDVELDKPDSGVQAYRIPLYADFLIAYSTIPGYFSWRNTQKGSWFIQSFCDEMNKNWLEFDFISILSFVNCRVAYEFESNVPNNSSMHRQKQIPCFTVQLTRLLKFAPKNVGNNGVNLQAHVAGKLPNSTTKDQVDALPDFITKIYEAAKEKKKISLSNKKDDVFYNIHHKKRGLAVVFNHKHFNDDLKLKPRIGTEKDCESLKQTLHNLGFEVQLHDDLRFKQLNGELKELSKYDFSDCDCLLICILSHGLQNEIIFAKDMSYSTNILFKRFTPDRCPTLAGKPKLFLIQACRGDLLDDGVDVEIDGEGGQNVYRIPSYADFLIAYSTTPDHVSWRSEIDGSWFIQTFCKEIDKNWTKYDLVSIFSFVNRSIAFEFESKVDLDPNSCHKKQIPAIIVMLTRLLNFYTQE